MKKIIAGIIILYLASMICIGCTTSEGERSGKLVKFSKSGLIIKSHEGILQLGETAESNWYFSVKDGNTKMIKFLKENIGKEISAKYQQRVWELDGIGYDRQCFIESAKVIKE